MNDNPSPPKQPRQYPDDLRQFTFRANDKMTQTIESLSRDRHQSFSNTIRLLITMGVQQYEINAMAGIKTTLHNQQETAKRRAQAEAAAARKSLRKQGDNKNVTVVTPILFGVHPDPDE